MYCVGLHGLDEGYGSVHNWSVAGCSCDTHAVMTLSWSTELSLYCACRRQFDNVGIPSLRAHGKQRQSGSFNVRQFMISLSLESLPRIVGATSITKLFLMRRCYAASTCSPPPRGDTNRRRFLSSVCNKFGKSLSRQRIQPGC